MKSFDWVEYDGVITGHPENTLHLTTHLIIQPRTILRSHAHDLAIGVRIRPDDIEAVVRISRRIFVPESFDNIRQSIVFPANENIA